MKETIRKAVDRALKELAITDPPEYVVERPKDPHHGDLAVNVAFLLARPLKKNPSSIAREIVARLDLDGSCVDKIEVAPNGFINFRISPRWNVERLTEIQRLGENYGRNDSLAGRRIMVEFVSSNPTGPLTVGHGRQAVLGDSLSSLLEASGARVTREYYYNDSGNQMNILGRSLFARYARRWDPDFPFPENGYQGDYLLELAEQFAVEHGERYRPASREEQAQEEVLKLFREYAAERIRQVIDRDLRRFRIGFDVWSLESRLYTEGKVEELLALLKEKNLSYEMDGAVWLCTSRFGDDEDRVIVKSTGEPTYFLPDLAYHLAKHERGFDEVINIHGADHHGYAPRMLAGMKALGYPEVWLRYVIHQMVSFVEGGEAVKMSTRAGKFVTLSDLMDDVGVNVARYFFLMRKADAHLVFDLDLARRQSNENPVYYCQYVHARICNLTPTAVEAGLWDGDRSRWGRHVPAHLSEPEETDIITHLVEYPECVRSAAQALEPHHLPTYLEDLAGRFHAWYQKHRIVDAAHPELSLDRLYLADCVRRVMADGLKLLGIDAPEKM